MIQRKQNFRPPTLVFALAKICKELIKENIKNREEVIKYKILLLLRIREIQNCFQLLLEGEESNYKILVL